MTSAMVSKLDCDDPSCLITDTISQTKPTSATSIAVIAYWDKNTTMMQRLKFINVVYVTPAKCFVKELAQERPATAVFFEKISVSASFSKKDVCSIIKGYYTISVNDSVVSMTNEEKGYQESVVSVFTYFFGADSKRGLISLTTAIPARTKKVNARGVISQGELGVKVVGDTAVQISAVTGTLTDTQKELVKKANIPFKCDVANASQNSILNKEIEEDNTADLTVTHRESLALFQRGQKAEAAKIILSTNKKFLPIDTGNVIVFNDFGYVLEQAGKFKEAKEILSIVATKFPARTVAWLNLGDAQKGLGKTGEAKESYRKYIGLMEQNGKSGKIPQRVKDYLKQN